MRAVGETIVGDRFEVEAVIARGARATVYQVRDRERNERRALKLLNDDTDMIEGHVLGTLRRCPYIVRAYLVASRRRPCSRAGQVPRRRRDTMDLADRSLPLPDNTRA